MQAYQMQLQINVACCILETSAFQAHSLASLNGVGTL